MASWSYPVNIMANVMDNIQQDPQANKIMLGIGMAYDAMRHTPPDLFATIPHFETEIDHHDSNTVGAPQLQPGASQ